MQRLILCATLALMGLTALVPAASAQQVTQEAPRFGSQMSTPDQISEDATLQDLILVNRDIRDKR
jgi:hypothetical protein